MASCVERASWAGSAPMVLPSASYCARQRRAGRIAGESAPPRRPARRQPCSWRSATPRATSLLAYRFSWNHLSWGGRPTGRLHVVREVLLPALYNLIHKSKSLYIRFSECCRHMNHHKGDRHLCGGCSLYLIAEPVLPDSAFQGISSSNSHVRADPLSRAVCGSGKQVCS